MYQNDVLTTYACDFLMKLAEKSTQKEKIFKEIINVTLIQH